ncbi:hypothetical protein EVAR_17786_1 [Eumeta japonica]|uniref:Uncharacterized protein n=1 Tax=Eumeta variegata TaxID=151549 RepID=A0A4C1TTH7_EUMVA|nr:hypothetical protein EVAR_17786_1 [Eumeta japonica]
MPHGRRVATSYTVRIRKRLATAGHSRNRRNGQQTIKGFSHGARTPRSPSRFRGILLIYGLPLINQTPIWNSNSIPLGSPLNGQPPFAYRRIATPILGGVTIPTITRTSPQFRAVKLPVSNSKLPHFSLRQLLGC